MIARKEELLLLKSAQIYWQNTTDMSFLKDTNGIYICASPSFTKMVGAKSANDIIGKTDFDIFEDKSLAKRYTDDDKTLFKTGNDMLRYIEPITMGDGRPRYAMTSKCIVKNDLGEPIGLFGFGRDITAEYEMQHYHSMCLKKFFDLPKNAYFSYLVDVSDWRLIDSRARKNFSSYQSEYQPLEEILTSLRKSIIDDGPAKAFYNNVSKPFIEKIYDGGTSDFSMEMLRQTQYGERWIRHDIRLLPDPVSGHLSLIIVVFDIDEEKRSQEKLVRAAERDAMTNLLNRDATIKAIQNTISTEYGLRALFMIDIDNFKLVNDTFGHQVGDKTLIDVAKILNTYFEKKGLVGRIGGDEFMGLLTVSDSEKVEETAALLVSTLIRDVKVNEKSVRLSASIGVVIFRENTSDFNTLYSKADTALYKAKHQGKNRHCLVFA